MFQQLKKKTSLSKVAYTRKPIKINDVYCKGYWAWGGIVNVLI